MGYDYLQTAVVQATEAVMRDPQQMKGTCSIVRT